MEILQYLNQPFFYGLGLGLLLAAFIWKSAFSDKGNLKREIKRIMEENHDLQKHLNTQLTINAEGNESLQKKLEELTKQNETLRVNLSALQQKPGRMESRQLRVLEAAASQMREQAPGFAQAWEQALKRAESEQEEVEGGLKKLMQKVIPALTLGGHAHAHKEVDAEEVDSKK